MTPLRDRLVFWLFRAVRALLFISPRPFGLLAGRLLGLCAYFLDKRHRSIALANLETALGSSLDARQRKKTARRCFVHFGRMFVDLVKLSQMGEARLGKVLTLQGEDTLRRALARGRGALLFSAHYGSWELAPFLLSRLSPLHVVARALDNRRLEEDLHRLRTRFGAKVIYKQQASRPILRALRANETAAILIDQNVLRSEAIFVEVFGRLAATTPSLALFHLRTGAPIIPVFCTPASSRTYIISVEEPLEVDLTGDSRQDVLNITQLCSKIIESRIRKNPELWFWFHQRWKTQPIEESQRQ